MEKMYCNENQKTFYYNWKKNPFSDAHHLYALFEIQGDLDVKKFTLIINNILSSHASFRFKFFEEEEQLFYIDSFHSPLLEYVQFKHSDNDFEKEMNDFIYDFFNRKFHLRKGLTSYVQLLHCPGLKRAYFLVNCHYITIDFYNFNFLFKESVSRLYRDSVESDLSNEVLKKGYKLSDEYCIKLNTLEDVSFTDLYSEKKGKEVKNMLDYQSRKRTAIYSYFSVGQKTKNQIFKYCYSNNISPFIFYLGCYIILLTKVLEKKKILVGIPISQSKDKNKELFEHFTSMLPLFIEILDNHRVKDLFINLKISLYKLLKYKTIDIKHTIFNNHQFLESGFIFDNSFTYFLEEEPFSIPGCKIRNIDVEKRDIHMPFSLLVQESRNKTIIKIEVEMELFKGLDIGKVFEKIIKKTLKSDQQFLYEVCFLELDE